MAEKEKKTEAKPRRLYRSEKDKIIAGVAGGIGEYFEIDPNIIRIIFVLLTIFGGWGLVLYIILWIALPTESNVDVVSGEVIRENIGEMKGRVRQYSIEVSKEDSRFWWGMLLLILGILFLFGNFGLFYFFDIFKLWPLVLIIIGLLILSKK